MALAMIAAQALACSDRSFNPQSAVVTTSSALTGAAAFTIPLPNATGLPGVSLAATNSLAFADRVVMMSPRTGSSAAVNTGTTPTTAGTDASLGTMISQSAMTIRDRSVVNGDAQSAGGVNLINGAHATGAVRLNTPITPLQTFSWTVTFPTPGSDVLLPPDGTRTLAAGSYGTITLNSRAILHLGAGTYYCNGLSAEPQSQIVLDSGPVFLYVAATPTFKGAIVPGAQQRHFLVAVVGTGIVLLESPFIGTIVAPNATVRFAPSSPAIYTGSFFGKGIDVQPMSTIALDTFLDWGTLFPLPQPRPVDVHPVLTCVASLGGGVFQALYGYVNDAFDSIRIRIGASNQFTPGPSGRGQVQRFFPGKKPAAFATRFTGAAITWTTSGGTATASSTSSTCPTSACAPACATGEACVGGNCVTLCGDGICAGDEGCDTCPSDCGCGAGQVCIRNGCANPIHCGTEWQCGAGSSFGVAVDCGACSGGRACVNHLCQ